MDHETGKMSATATHTDHSMARKMSRDVFDVDAQRQQLAGPSGVAGLLRNPRLFLIAMATAQGGLCYGYEQGACESTVRGSRGPSAGDFGHR